MVQEGELDLTDSRLVPADSLATDSLGGQPAHVFGIILTPPESPDPAPQRPFGEGVSFILSGLFILSLIIGLRFHNNIKYAVAMFRNLVETRTRQNIFDDNVRETSLIVMLNLLWCASSGIIAFCFFKFMLPQATATYQPALGMLWGMALAALYSCGMACAYSSVGWIFADRSHAQLWLKGFSASQALMAPPFFIIAFFAVGQPNMAPQVACVAIVVFVIIKLVFIWKGYKIFFSQSSSWVLFLCYLCSLEIVPLILCYRLAILLVEML